MTPQTSVEFYWAHDAVRKALGSGSMHFNLHQHLQRAHAALDVLQGGQGGVYSEDHAEHVRGLMAEHLRAAEERISRPYAPEDPHHALALTSLSTLRETSKPYVGDDGKVHL